MTVVMLIVFGSASCSFSPFHISLVTLCFSVAVCQQTVARLAAMYNLQNNWQDYKNQPLKTISNTNLHY